jgi:hypothetical protein
MPSGTPRTLWENHIKIDLREIEYEGEKWMKVVHECVHSRDIVLGAFLF